MTNTKCDTIYYDGACPLCRAEMDKLATQKPRSLTLIDIHDVKEHDALPDKTTLLKRLHLRTADGEWLTGLDANLHAWHGTPMAWLARVLNLPGIRHIASWCYERWALWRYKRLYGS